MTFEPASDPPLTCTAGRGSGRHICTSVSAGGWRIAPSIGDDSDMAVSDSTHAGGSETSEPRYRLPHQALYAIAAGLVIVAIVLTVVALTRDTTGTGSTLPPPVTPSPVSTTSVATPTPTPTSADERAAADAAAAFAGYIRAQNLLTASGGDDADLATAKKLTTKNGPERKYLTGSYVKELRDGAFKSSGWSKVTTKVNAVELGEKPLRVDLTACLDQRAFKVTKDGKPFKAPQFLRYAAVMNLVEGKWLVDRIENATADLDPQELTFCEP